MDDKELFDDIKLSDILKDVHDTTLRKRKKIEAVIQQVSDTIKTVDDAISLSPIIKDFYDVSIKNDEQLIKMLGVVTKGKTTTDQSGDILTDQEKEQLLAVANAHTNISVPELPVGKITPHTVS